jgi:outer membrane protein OmpA-like peptidoglycan-associated protein
MRHKAFALLATVTFTTFVSGCATKGYVRNNVQPVQAQLDQVAEQSNRQGEQLTQTRQDVDKNTTAITGVDEKATAADRRAGEAMSRADAAGQKATQNTQEIASLRNTIVNLDNYKVVQTATVLFAFDRATLQPEDKEQLDQLVSNTGRMKRYFIAIEGYTDPTGDAAYNLDLSKRRADAVVQYLAGERDVDFNRIHTIGLGEQKLVDAGATRDARARNRRVEVKIYSADDVLTTASGAAGSN